MLWSHSRPTGLSRPRARLGPGRGGSAPKAAIIEPRVHETNRGEPQERINPGPQQQHSQEHLEEPRDLSPVQPCDADEGSLEREDEESSEQGVESRSPRPGVPEAHQGGRGGSPEENQPEERVETPREDGGNRGKFMT